MKESGRDAADVKNRSLTSVLRAALGHESSHPSDTGWVILELEGGKKERASEMRSLLVDHCLCRVLQIPYHPW